MHTPAHITYLGWMRETKKEEIYKYAYTCVQQIEGEKKTSWTNLTAFCSIIKQNKCWSIIIIIIALFRHPDIRMNPSKELNETKIQQRHSKEKIIFFVW